MPLGYFTGKDKVVHPIGGVRRARQVAEPANPYHRQVDVQVQEVPEEPGPEGEEDFTQTELVPEEQPGEEEAATSVDQQVAEEPVDGAQVQEQEVGPVTPEEHARFLTKRQGYS